MPVTSLAVLPVLVSIEDQRRGDGLLIDEFLDHLGVAYTPGPAYGERLLSWADLERMDLPRRSVRRSAADNLESMLGAVKVHGRPPALMLAFEGLASSVLLAEDFWDRIARVVPGDLVVGVPARDVVIITGSGSEPGMERARRAVERIFFAGDQHLLSRDLLVRREYGWEPLRLAAPHQHGHGSSDLPR